MKKDKTKKIRDLVIGFSIPILFLPFMYGYAYWITTLLNQIEYLPVNQVSLVIKDYATISLSLFGITLIGGIFEKKEEKKIVNSKKLYFHNVKGSLFVISILFLFAFFLFEMSYWGFFPIIAEDLTIPVWLLYFGFLSFTMAVFYLLLILIVYYLFSYTTIPETFGKIFKKIERQK